MTLPTLRSFADVVGNGQSAIDNRARAAMLVAVACLTATPALAKQVTVTIDGGSTITAELLRQSDDGVVLDLGHEVLRIAAQQILDIRDPEGQTVELHAQNEHIFTLGRLKAQPVPQLVAEFGDAIVIVRTPRGLGSGFVISDRGHIITNYHVVEGETRIRVTLFRPTEQGYDKLELEKVKILALQPLRDIALLQLDLDELEGWAPKPVVISDQNDLSVGDLVFAVGNPLGLERSVTQGIVSSTTRTIGQLRFIQTDTSINPGNSGGPLFNARGEVVGIVCAGFVFFDGLAFGIPASDLVDFLQHRDAYLYDPAQPQNAIKYLDPPWRPNDNKDAADNSDKSDQ